MILTPEGKVARYLYGINYRALDLRFGLAEAAENRSTLTIEKVLLFCYHYDPVENKYVLFATNFMKAGGALTILILGWFSVPHVPRGAAPQGKTGMKDLSAKYEGRT